MGHTIIEAEKSYDLLSEGWRTRKVSDIIQYESKGPRIKRDFVTNANHGEALS